MSDPLSPLRQGSAERGAVRRPACGCFKGDCWEIVCVDCGQSAEDYDDECASDYIVHWPDPFEALDGCSALGFEVWEDDPEQPVLCRGCLETRLGL